MGSLIPETTIPTASVIAGEASIDSLNTVVAHLDAMREDENSRHAQDDTDDLGNTPPKKPETATVPEDGVITSNEEYEAFLKSEGHIN